MIKIKKIIYFIQTGIWRIRLKDLPPQKSFFIKHLRVLLLTIRGFQEDRCPLRASALTFYSLLSIVPVMAMAFGIAKGFGFEKLLEKHLLEQFEGQREVLVQVIAFARTMIENAKGGLIAGIGVCLLFWSIIKVLGHIEKSLNDIWEIKKERPFGRKFTDYLSIMLIAPVLVIVSNSVTVFIITQITEITEKVAFLGTFSALIFFFLKLLPYGLIWIVFTTIYILMPNTRVKFKAGLLAGILAGSIYHIVQWTYIKFQVGAAQYNAIYGSFAALPLFLIWLQLSWLIVLLGAEFSFAYQNVDNFEFEPDCKAISSVLKRHITLMIAHLIVKNFAGGGAPLTAFQISHKLDIPIRLVNRILADLIASRLFSSTRLETSDEPAYQPARDINELTVQFVIEALDSQGVNTLPVLQAEEYQKISEILQEFNHTLEQSSGNKPFKDL